MREPPLGAREAHQDLGMGAQQRFEPLWLEVRDVEYRVAPAVQNQIDDLALDAVRWILEQTLGERPGAEDLAPDDAGERQAVHDDALEALDLEVTGVQPEEHHVAAASRRLDGVVDRGVEASHLECDVEPD